MKILIVIGWIFIPYIMIFLEWKKMGIVKKMLGAVWAFIAFVFFLIALIASTAWPQATTKTPVESPKPVSTISPIATPEAKTNKPTVMPVDVNEPKATDDKNNEYDIILKFPIDKYPETASHIQAAIKNGEPAVCTINRPEADANREKSLRGIPTKDGYDRDEWPMAMCDEGGKGADVAYVKSSDNRGSGSWVGNQLENYPNGTRILFVIDGATGTVNEITKQAPVKTPVNTPSPKPASENESVYYENCSAVKAAGKAPIRKGDPGYSTKLDGDKDGVACEK
jgi:hypothetical protein